MPNINFNCPSCETKDKITLMGESHGVFEKKCKECGITIELTVEDNELKIFYSEKSKSRQLIIEWLKLQANNFLRTRLLFLSKRIKIQTMLHLMDRIWSVSYTHLRAHETPEHRVWPVMG